MTAVSGLRTTDQPAADEPPPLLELVEMSTSTTTTTTTTTTTNCVDDDERNSVKRKHKRRNREERRKRSRSFSSDDGSCSSVGSKKKKKRKKRQKRRSLDEPPSPKVNPIFLWVKEDNAKIVEVRCEDYDRRNRIKLTKTACGWRAIPHVEIKQFDTQLASTSRSTDDSENESSTAPKLEPEVPLGHSDLYSVCRDDMKNDTPPPPLLVSYQDDAVDYRNGEDRFEIDDAVPNITVISLTDDSGDVKRSRTSDEEMTFDLTDEPEKPPSPVIYQIYDSDEEEANDKRLNDEKENNDDVAKLSVDTQVQMESDDVVIPNDAPPIEKTTNVEIVQPSTTDKDESSSDVILVENDDSGDCDSNQLTIQEDDNVKLTSTEGIDQIEKENPLDLNAAQNDDPDDALRLLQSENDDSIQRPSNDVFPELPEIVDDVESTKIDDDKSECGIKCCEETPSTTVDENHNNEFEPNSPPCLIEPSNFCQDVLEILGAMEDNSMTKQDRNDDDDDDVVDDENGREMTTTENRDDVEYDHSALMTELEEMMNERLKQDNVKPPVLDDIYNFVPSPSVQSKSKESRPTSKIERVIEAVKAKSAKANALKSKETVKTDLDNLDMLWRLPEGTTIHHSKPSEKEVESAAPIVKFDPAISTTISLVKSSTPIVTTSLLVEPGPVQEEPLNLGKPRRQSTQILTSPSVMPQSLKKEAPTPTPTPTPTSTPAPIPPSCKIETKPSTDSSDLKNIKVGKASTPDASKNPEPLAQLKEIMSDPDFTVPDPLLVPKERLSALIANPKREIPRLMALTNEVKYPKVDTNMLEVSLAHLQLLLQSSKKEDELKLFQKHADILQSHLKNDGSTLDPATMSALNQMLWFPYLSHLEVGRGGGRQDLVGMMNMMYPYNAWAQPPHYDYPHQSHLMNFWQDARSKPGVHSPKNYADLYKTIPPSMPTSLYTSAPSVDPSSRVLPSPSFPTTPRNVKHQTSRRHRSSSSASHRPQRPLSLAHVTPPNIAPSLHPRSSHHFLKPPPHFDMSPWSLPQTSDSSQRLALKNSSSPFVSAPSSNSSSSTSYRPPISSSSSSTASEHPPKLKVRKFDVDPNAVPKLINKNLTAPALAPLAAMTRQVPSQYYGANHLWNPLYAPPESREGDYSTGHWNWTTPVTVSGK